MGKKALKMNEKDNVATVLSDIKQGELISVVSSEGTLVDDVVARQDITFGFKVSLKDIPKDKKIVKYGANIGTCYRQIVRGELVHIQNIKSDRISIPQERIDAMIKDLGI